MWWHGLAAMKFAVILPRASRETVDMIMQRLKLSIEAFNAENEEFLLSISTGMAIGHSKSVNLTQLFRDADNNMYREKNRSSQQIRAAITHTVVRLLERRDYVLEGHTRRVAQLCERLAVEIGFSQTKIADLLLLAEYHDLGKVGIADQILFKKGPLDLTERKKFSGTVKSGTASPSRCRKFAISPRIHSAPSGMVEWAGLSISRDEINHLFRTGRTIAAHGVCPQALKGDERALWRCSAQRRNRFFRTSWMQS